MEGEEQERKEKKTCQRVGSKIINDFSIAAAAKQGPREPRCGVTQRALSLLTMGHFRGCGRIRSRELLSNSNLAATNMNRKKTSQAAGQPEATCTAHPCACPGGPALPTLATLSLLGSDRHRLLAIVVHRPPTCSPREKSWNQRPPRQLGRQEPRRPTRLRRPGPL